MLDKFLDLVSKNHSERKESILEIIKVLFTIFLSFFPYQLIFGDFTIINFENLDKIIPFFTSGDFLKPLIIYTIVWHLFYYIIKIPLTLFIAQKVEAVSSVIANIFKELFANDLTISLSKSENYPKWATKIGGLLKDLSIVQEIDGQWKAGHNFRKTDKFIEDIENGEDDIDTSYFIDSIILCVQFAIIYFGHLIWHNNIAWWFSLIVLVILVGYVILCCFIAFYGMLFSIFVIPIKNWVENFEEDKIKILSIP